MFSNFYGLNNGAFAAHPVAAGGVPANTGTVKPDFGGYGDARIDGDAPSAVAPFRHFGGHMLVKLSIDGSKPMSFILDISAPNLLTQDAAKALRLKKDAALAFSAADDAASGAYIVIADTCRLGNLVLHEQCFTVTDLPQTITDRGQREPIAGVIGYELLRRFITRIDYGRHEFTFIARPSFFYDGDGARLPLFFTGRTPQIVARIDNEAGLFSLEPGNNNGVTVFRSFAAAHGIKLKNKITDSLDSSTDRTDVDTFGTARTLSLGVHGMSGPRIRLASRSTGTAAADNAAGHIGRSVLSNFVMIFDYEQRHLFLEKSGAPSDSRVYGDSGIDVERNKLDCLRVNAVHAGSAGALAGIWPGDEITAINHIPIRHMDLNDIQLVLRQPAGVRLQFDTVRAGQAQQREIVLRE